MIAPRHHNVSAKLADSSTTLDALRHARAAAARRHAAAGQPLLDWRDGRIVPIDAGVVETKDKKKVGGGGMDDMGDMDF